MKIYVAGPMRGIPEHNYPAFIAATADLRAQGHEVFSPVEWDIKTHGPSGCNAGEFDLRAALAADLEWICRSADAVALLPGWENSKGAQAELATARAIGLVVVEIADGVPFPSFTDRPFGAPL